MPSAGGIMKCDVIAAGIVNAAKGVRILTISIVPGRHHDMMLSGHGPTLGAGACTRWCTQRDEGCAGFRCCACRF